jgi:hypothetical protein
MTKVNLKEKCKIALKTEFSTNSAQHRFCAIGADEQTSSFNRYCASVNRLDKFLNRPGKLLSSPGGQSLLVPGLSLRLIKSFVSLQQDGQSDVILIPRLTQSRGRCAKVN